MAKNLSRKGIIKTMWGNPDGTFTYEVTLLGTLPRVVLGPQTWGGLYAVTYVTDVPNEVVKVTSTTPDLLGQFVYLMWE